MSFKHTQKCFPELGSEGRESAKQGHMQAEGGEGSAGIETWSSYSLQVLWEVFHKGELSLQLREALLIFF